jgi:hypothetical protein
MLRRPGTASMVASVQLFGGAYLNPKLHRAEIRWTKFSIEVAHRLSDAMGVEELNCI